MNKQKKLFEEEEEHWTKEWQDMPEYVQEDKGAIKSIVVNFETAEHMKQFSELIGQNITFKTRGIFYPVVKKVKKFYTDES